MGMGMEGKGVTNLYGIFAPAASSIHVQDGELFEHLQRGGGEGEEGVNKDTGVMRRKAHNPGVVET